MLKALRLTEVGPASHIDLYLAPRLNMITGDNGLGKTFILECAWWALTGTWAGYQAYPHQRTKRLPNISFQVGTDDEPSNNMVARYQWEQQNWSLARKRNGRPGLAIYCMADGSFATWDAAAEQLHKEDEQSGRWQPLSLFSNTQVWNGFEPGQKGYDQMQAEGELEHDVAFHGLLQDWISWQSSSDTTRFEQFADAIEMLSSYQDEPLVPGELQHLTADGRTIPTLKFSYGDVPVVHCAAGYRRMLALAYVLVWAWHRHQQAAELLEQEPSSDIVLLVDEMEAHLHPQWQRAIVPALMQVIQKLYGQGQPQVLVATHSPLVLASVETLFDEEHDSLFHLYLEHGQVHLDTVNFVKRGRADLWLMSEVFGLKQPRSKDAEVVIEEAKQLQQNRKPAREEVEKVSHQLVGVLAPDDEFWPRWKYFAERSGVSL
jgi:hypothetical protein